VNLASIQSWVKQSLIPQPVGAVVEVAGTIVQIAMSGAKLGDVVVIET
jgi:hypothetical protein